MKKQFYFLLIPFFCLSATCRKTASPGIPSCVQNIIKQIKAEKVWNPPGSIWSYQYNGQTVYYIPSRCCDIPSRLYDSNCNLICYPDGGFTGRGDGKCKDFSEKRTQGKLIWKDDRK